MAGGIDPNVLAGLQNIKPVQIQDPLEMYGNFQRAQYMQGQNALNALNVQKQTAIANAFANSMNPDGTPNLKGAIGWLANHGGGAAIPEMQQALLKINQVQAETSKTQGEDLAQRIALSRDRFGAINPKAPDALDQVHSVIKSEYADPVLGDYLTKIGADPNAAMARANDAAKNGTLDQFINHSALAADKLLKVSTAPVNIGGQTEMVSTNDFGTPNPTVTGTFANTQSPDNKATNETSRENSIRETQTQKQIARMKIQGDLTGKNLGAANDELGKLWQTARESVPAIANDNEALALIPHAITGMGSAQKAALGRIGEIFGFTGDQAPTNTQELAKILKQNLIAKLSSIPGNRASQKEIEWLNNATPNELMNPNSITKMVQWDKEYHKYQFDTYNQAQKRWSASLGNQLSYPALSMPDDGVLPSNLSGQATETPGGSWLFNGKPLPVGSILGGHRYKGGDPNQQTSWEAQ